MRQIEKNEAHDLSAQVIRQGNNESVKLNGLLSSVILFCIYIGF
jgi:hypothetical protein